MRHKKSHTILIFIVLSGTVIAGTSMFGFGPQLPGTYQNSFTTVAAGRGGVEMAIIDSMSLNQSNFALWSMLSRTTISINLLFQGITTKSNTQNIGSFDANVHGGFLAIPLLKKKFVIGVGLIPQIRNDIGVKIQSIGIGAAATQTVNTSGNIGEAKFIAAYAPFDNFSLALVPSYTFGFISDEISIVYDDIAYGDISVVDKYKIYGPGFGLYAFYQTGQKFAVGGKVKLPSKLTLFTEQTSLSKVEIIDKFRKVTLPLNWGAGVSYKLSNSWQAGLDFDYKNWKNGYKIEGNTVNNLDNSYRIGIGIERLPQQRRFISTMQDITYRGGLFYGQLYKRANDNSVYEYGISLGLGLPILRNNSHMDFAFEYGQRGDLAENFLKESFFRLHISISANELWFQREKR
jgi:hypothetical protein